MLFVVCCVFSKSNLSEKLSGIASVSNNFDPDQYRRFGGPGLDPKCVQMLSACDTSRQRVG